MKNTNKSDVIPERPTIQNSEAISTDYDEENKFLSYVVCFIGGILIVLVITFLAGYGLGKAKAKQEIKHLTEQLYSA